MKYAMRKAHARRDGMSQVPASWFLVTGSKAPPRTGMENHAGTPGNRELIS